MTGARVGRWLRRGSLALGALSAASCLHDVYGPASGTSAHLAVAPTFATSAAGVVDFTRVRVTVMRPASTTRAERSVVDTTVPFPATADSVELAVKVPLEALSEEFLVYLRLVTSAGDTVFRNTPYPQSITARAGAASAMLQATFTYVGVGHDAVAISITTPDTLVSTGQAVDLAAVARDTSQIAIPGTPIAWSSLDPLRVAIPDAALGQAVGGTARGPARIVASLLTGPADTMLINSQPIAAQVRIVGGAGQQDTAGALLPLPLQVQVTGGDGLGVVVPVWFRALSPGAAVTDSMVVSDTLGFAQTSVMLGGVAGAQAFEATVGGVPGATMTATALPGAPAQLGFTVQPKDAPLGVVISPSVEVSLQDAFGNTLPTPTTLVTLRLGTNPGGALLGGTASVATVQGVATFADLTLDQLGGGYTLVASATGLTSATSAPFTISLTAPTPIVLFAGDSSGGLSSGVFSTDRDGLTRLRLTDQGSIGDVHPRQSPDLRRVAFTYGGLPAVNELFVVARTADTVASLVADTSARRPRWSTDGVRLAFECGDGVSPAQDVCVIPDVTGPIASLAGIGDGAGKVVVTDFAGAKSTGPASFAWDPADAKRLIVVRDSMLPGGDRASRLWTVGFDGQGAVPLSPDVMDVGKGPLRIVGPFDVTPDGLTIVFAAVDLGSVQRLYAVQRDGTGLRQVTSGPFDWQPVISPDGQQLVFLRDAGCAVDYWQINVDGGGEQQITDEKLCGVDTSLLGHDWSPDGKDLVLIGTDATLNALVYRVPAGTGAANYRAARVLIGQGVGIGGFVSNIQPSWRP